MAKKKAAMKSTGDGKPTKVAKKKSASGRKLSTSNGAAKKTPASTRPLSNLQIGEVAGEVWHALEGGEALTVANVKKQVDAPPELVTAAIGWLAREDKLDFNQTGRSLKLTLRDA